MEEKIASPDHPISEIEKPVPETNQKRTVDVSRRGFLGSTGAGVAAVTAAGAGLFASDAEANEWTYGTNRGWHGSDIPSVLKLQRHPTIHANPYSEAFWYQVRKAFVLPKNYFHFNTGTTGTMPLFSMRNLAVYNYFKSADPRDWEANMHEAFPNLFPLGSLLGFLQTGVIPRQQAVAAAYGANDDEILLSYNTTDALNLIFSGTPWNPGDRIVTTNLEHAAAQGPMAWARDYRGVTVAIVDLPSNFTSAITKEQVLALFQAEFSKPLPAGGKQYLVTSEIFYKNGLRLPVKELSQLAKRYGAFTIYDTAHGWGQIPIDCHDYEADFIAGAGHKWLCGGPGTGICYIRNSGDNLPPMAPGNFLLYGDQFTAPSPLYDTRSWPPNAYMQLRGEYNTPALYAMTDSLSFFKHVGLRRIYKRGVELAKYLQRKVIERWGPGALWVNPGDPAFRTAFTSFNPFKGKDDPAQFAAMSAAMTAIYNNLGNPTTRGGIKMYVRFTTWRDKHTDPADNRIGFRISTHAMYTNFDMIDILFDSLVREVDATGLPQRR